MKKQQIYFVHMIKMTVGQTAAEHRHGQIQMAKLQNTWSLKYASSHLAISTVGIHVCPIVLIPSVCCGQQANAMHFLVLKENCKQETIFDTSIPCVSSLT